MTVRKNGHRILQAPEVGSDILFTGDWRAESLCSQLPVAVSDALFYPRLGGDTRTAKLICSGCPVRVECLNFALNDPDAYRYGIWGGTSGRERRGKRPLERFRAANVQQD